MIGDLHGFLAGRCLLMAMPPRPANPDKVTFGVYAEPASKTLVLDDLAGNATIDFSVKTAATTALADAATLNFRLSFKPDGVASAAFTLPDALADAAYVRAEKVGTPILAGYETWSVYVMAKEDGPGKFTLAAGEVVLKVALELSANADKVASLALSHADATYYSASYLGGAAGIDADAKITPPAATAAVRFRWRYDVTGDGEVTLADVDLVRLALGKTSADADWASRWAVCDLDGSGAVGVEDLTLMIAAYEATVP